MAKSILAVLGSIGKFLASVWMDIVILAGLGFVVRASFMVSPMAGYYTLGGILTLVGLAAAKVRR